MGARLHVQSSQLNPPTIDARLLALIATKTDNLVVMTDPQGLIQWVNASFIRITGYVLSDVIGRKPGSFLQGPDTDPETVRTMRRHFANREGFSVQILNYAKDKRPYWLEIDVSPITDEHGTILHFIAIERDVTEKRRQLDDLRVAKDVALKAFDALRALEATRQVLANALVHDMRSPLMAMTLILESFIEQARPVLTTPQVEDISHLQTGIQELTTMISGLLEMARLKEVGIPMHCTDADLSVLTRLAVDQVRGMDLGRSIQIQAGPLESVHCDQNLIVRVVANLVSNAIKYSPQGSPVVIALMDREGEAIVSVTDCGEGIPPDLQEQIFQRFGAINPSFESSAGLGLAFCRMVIEGHGGRIWVDSAPGRGATFSFTLKYRPLETAETT